MIRLGLVIRYFLEIKHPNFLSRTVVEMSLLLRRLTHTKRARERELNFFFLFLFFFAVGVGVCVCVSSLISIGAFCGVVDTRKPKYTRREGKGKLVIQHVVQVDRKGRIARFFHSLLSRGWGSTHNT